MMAATEIQQTSGRRHLHLRPGELHELRAGDVDLEAGEVSISRSWDEGIKGTKTDAGTRIVAIPPELAPLLVALVTDKPGATLLAPIMTDTANENRAEIFRAHLKLAGVTRDGLYADTATHEAIDFRSIRDTGITWRFLAGHRAELVQREAGHTELSTTLGYAKEVENRGGRYGDPFPAVPGACEPRVTVHTKPLKNPGKLVARARNSTFLPSNLRELLRSGCRSTR